MLRGRRRAWLLFMQTKGAVGSLNHLTFSKSAIDRGVQLARLPGFRYTSGPYAPTLIVDRK